MRILVDTHVWLWMLSEPARLPSRSQAVLADSSNEILVSAVTAWEIAIKHGLGKIFLPEDPAMFVPSRLTASGCTALAIEHADALIAGALPHHHRDPFDRLLIAQSQALGVPLCTADKAIRAYRVEVLWD